MKILCVAEKPSIAKSVAQHLGGGRVTTVSLNDFIDVLMTFSMSLLTMLETSIRGNQYVKNYEFTFNFQRWGNCSVVMTSVLGHLTNLDFEGRYKSWQAVNPSALFEAGTIEVIAEVSGSVPLDSERFIVSRTRKPLPTILRNRPDFREFFSYGPTAIEKEST